jgi:NAD-dependent dihydropyrimidine dehydrogenase PreA subunit
MIDRLDRERCNDCGLCLAVCPSDVFRRRPSDGHVVIAFADDCQTCFTCELDCPRAALHVDPLRRARPQAW